MTITALITAALGELGVLGAGQTASGALADLGLQTLNRLFDAWNAQRRAVYVDVTSSHTLTPALQPHTIGPSGATFTTDQRPVSLEGAALIVDDLHYPIRIRDAAWWLHQPHPTLTSDRPTDLYYAPAWPSGSLYLWPVPSAAHTIELRSRVVLDAVALADTFTMPPGYELAVMLSLAELLARPLGRPADGSLIAQARQARAVIFANNDETPALTTVDAGIPGAGGRSYFDYERGY